VCIYKLIRERDGTAPPPFAVLLSSMATPKGRGLFSNTNFEEGGVIADYHVALYEVDEDYIDRAIKNVMFTDHKAASDPRKYLRDEVERLFKVEYPEQNITNDALEKWCMKKKTTTITLLKKAKESQNAKLWDKGYAVSPGVTFAKFKKLDNDDELERFIDDRVDENSDMHSKSNSSLAYRTAKFMKWGDFSANWGNVLEVLGIEDTDERGKIAQAKEYINTIIKRSSTPIDCIPDWHFFDEQTVEGVSPIPLAAMFSNEPSKGSTGANCELRPCKPPSEKKDELLLAYKYPKMQLVATKKIKKNEELVWSYSRDGQDYERHADCANECDGADKRRLKQEMEKKPFGSITDYSDAWGRGSNRRLVPCTVFAFYMDLTKRFDEETLKILTSRTPSDVGGMYTAITNGSHKRYGVYVKDADVDRDLFSRQTGHADVDRDSFPRQLRRRLDDLGQTSVSADDLGQTSVSADDLGQIFVRDATQGQVELFFGHMRISAKVDSGIGYTFTYKRRTGNLSKKLRK